MADEQLEKELALARRAAPVFGLGRQQQVIWGARRRAQGTRISGRRLVSLAMAACLCAGLAAAYVGFRAKTDEVAARATPDEHWELRDGSRILIETPDTRITKQRESNDEVVFELERGAARFDVAHRPERVFRVQAGPVQVEVIGTRFRVEREDAQTLVAVERGRVRVSWSGASTELSAGEHGVYPPPQAVANATTPAAPETAPSAAAPASAETVRSIAPPASAELAPPDTAPASSSHTAANEATSRAASAEDLFTTADHARAAGQPLEAAHALRELTQRFPHDGRAPLAAFTLGRLLQESLGQPAAAARAFAQARALGGGNSALAEDALAREADAWRAAGRSDEASRCAKLYQSLYPRGTHLKAALRVGEPSP
jgi:transmembrane sensor